MDVPVSVQMTVRNSTNGTKLSLSLSASVGVGQRGALVGGTLLAACGLRPSVQPGAEARVLRPALVVLVQPHHLRVWCVFVCALQRVNLLNATKTMWPAVPSVVTNVLKSLTFDTLQSAMPAGA